MLPGTPRGNLTRNEAKEWIYAFRYLFNNPQSYSEYLQDPGVGGVGRGIVGRVMSEEVLQSTCKDPACLSCKRDEVRTRSKGSRVIELV